MRWPRPFPPCGRARGGDGSVRVATIALLQAAQAGGYALGAFNVYNLEGVRAVVGAAEELHSPAILQIHPAALRHGGTALVALCLGMPILVAPRSVDHVMRGVVERLFP